MHPLMLKPAVKDYLWGGTRLKSEFFLESQTQIAAEGWMLSCHKDGPSVVENGELKGKTLPEVLEIWGEKAVGKKGAAFKDFPILIKLIDAKQKLSVQVHPDDSYALKNEGEFGKTEMWYVVDCEEGAKLIYGFTENISTEEFIRRIEENTLTDVCNFVPVNKGDVFFIPAGTLHAIGDGILIAEVQQNSNSTYRVSDYGRLGADGKPRELHVQKAIDVTRCEIPTVPYGQVGEIKADENKTTRLLAQCDLFTAKFLKLKGKTEILNEESFVCLLCLEGESELSFGNEKIKITKGKTVFIPAGVGCFLEGNGELLYVNM